ncbi:hypothetical protein [Terracidiphilus sp.]|jgi:hypothetical protein|uniref:hypothetical protein n=1 Tax=Terracidiphilus sp. TaxID=1964191 RepID=UPI003C258983
MPIRRNLLTCCLLLAAFAPCAIAVQTHPAKPAAPQPPAAVAAPVPSDKEVATTQRQLIELLRLSPTLTTVISRDPSLLANQDYVSRNNPQLAAFMATHPEIARNPDFYLFTHINAHDDSPDEALERAVWPEVYRMQAPRSGFDNFLSDLPPVLAMIAFVIAAGWIVRLFIENRRWSRTFQLQSEVHGRIIDRFATTQELSGYMETEAGRKFLEAAPIPLHAAQDPMPNAVARVLTPLQIGVVMILLGIGFLLLRNVRADYHTPMLVLGVVTLMPGIGFILSSGLTWALAGRLGLMPGRDSRTGTEQ